MGRAERRVMERLNRIEDRKNKVLVSRERLTKMKEELSYKAAAYSAENLMTCFALVLSRRGFDDDDIVQSLQDIDALMNDILSGESTMQDYLKEVEDRTGIIVKCKED